MSRRPDKLAPYEAPLLARGTSDPWGHARGEPPRYSPDYELLGQLLSIPVGAGEGSESGAFAKGIDAWVAHELRRAGFGSDEVWPRATRPRVLPRDVAVLLDKLPRELAAAVRARARELPAVTPADAVILGRAYDKQVDVVISRWDRGPELLVSTKAQVSSFGKNLPNRFEEAYGDAGNLRGRHPLAAVGFLFVQRSTILTAEPDAFERTVDMIRKLRATPTETGGYTATGLVVVEWGDPALGVRVRTDAVPDDVAAPGFFARLVEHVISVTPVVHHVRVRELIERRNLAVREADADAAAADTGPGPGDDPDAGAAGDDEPPGALDVPLFPDWCLG